MTKKTIDSTNISFIQAINFANKWCMEWEEDLLSEEVLADRIAELLKTKNGCRGFFAYALSDENCSLLDKLPNSLIFKFREQGEDIVQITVKNLIMSSAQIITHQKERNKKYESISKNIAERSSNLLALLDTNLVTKAINNTLNNLDEMGNSMDNSTKYNFEQKEFIRQTINNLAH